MKNWLINSFGFTKREYNGLLALMTIVLLVSALPYFYITYVVRVDQATPDERAAISKLILVSEESASPSNKFGVAVTDGEKAPPIKLFAFDPNEIGVSEWEKLGLSTKQAQAIINYRSKGGKFRRPSDLQKMYTISPSKFDQLRPYIQLQGEVTRQNSFVAAKKTAVGRALSIIEVNIADTTQLDLIKGIGAAFARRIVNYRDRLGGFYKKEQLMEVYGLDSLKYAEIKDQVTIDVSSIRKISINTATFEQLKNHPYLTYKQMNALIQYRKQHGKFGSIDDLRKVVLLSAQNIQNLAPYLIF